MRLKDVERLALLQAAKARSTTPANWLRSLAIVHLGRRPQWDANEAQALREIGEELRRIGNNVNQIARALNVAALDGKCPPHQGEVAMAAVQDVRAEMRRLVAVYTGNFDYWGLPDADRPTAAPGALKGEEQTEGEARSKRRLRPRRRPQAFTSVKAGEVTL